MKHGPKMNETIELITFIKNNNNNHKDEQNLALLASWWQFYHTYKGSRKYEKP